MESSNVQHLSLVRHTPEVSMNGSFHDIEDDNQLSLCCLCGKTFPTISSLHFHIDSEHDDDANENLPSAIEQEPSGSDAAYFLPSPRPSPSTAILPVPSPDDCNTTENYYCPICKRRFSGHTSLKVHMETIHHGNRSATCELCQKRFSTLSYLRLHIATVHEGLKAYTCSTCSKSYTQKHSLKKHISTAHPSSPCDKSSNHSSPAPSRNPPSIAPAPPSSSYVHQRLIAPAKPVVEPGTVSSDSSTDLYPPVLVAEISTTIIDNFSTTSSSPTASIPPPSTSFIDVRAATTVLDGNYHGVDGDAH